MAVRTLELHRLADTSADRPTDAAGRELPWPLADVGLTSDPPKEIDFSDDWVMRGMAEVAAGAPAWLELTNARPHPTSITAPAGGDAGKTKTQMAMTGDEIVLDLLDERRAKNGEKPKAGTRVTLRYKVLEAPGVYLDESEGAGYRISHGYRARLVSGKGE